MHRPVLVGRDEQTDRRGGGEDEYDRAYDELEREAPDRVSRALRWLREPKARRVRIPLGILFVLASFLWFLPVIGIELLPIGLLLLAHDIPFLRKPVGRALLWLEGKWRALRRRWRAWREEHAGGPEPRHEGR